MYKVTAKIIPTIAPVAAFSKNVVRSNIILPLSPQNEPHDVRRGEYVYYEYGTQVLFYGSTRLPYVEDEQVIE